MQYLVLGNWKSNGTKEMVAAFAADYARPENLKEKGVGTGLALPHHLLYLHQQLGDVMCGAQNVSAFGEGAYTGEITAGMLVEAGCNFALIGHSERRQFFGETVAHTADKLKRLIQAGIYPVFCIGETLEQRREGRLEAVLREQLAPFVEIDGVTPLAVAYEPVWAIGTGVAASNEEVDEAHVLVKSIMAGHGFKQLPVLYGGSVKPGNAEALAQLDGVDGFLVGGASLKGQDLGGILAGFLSGKNL